MCLCTSNYRRDCVKFALLITSGDCDAILNSFRDFDEPDSVLGGVCLCTDTSKLALCLLDIFSFVNDKSSNCFSQPPTAIFSLAVEWQQQICRRKLLKQRKARSKHKRNVFVTKRKCMKMSRGKENKKKVC